LKLLQDYPLPIGCSETISAPHMHATALEVLESKLQPGNSILDVGSVRCLLFAKETS
jgi:protein-L-isoaspartate(D-aspartate) O-methyltransferase